MIKEFFGKVAGVIVEHQPVVATVVLVGTVIATGIVIYKESPKIHKAMDDRKKDFEDIEKNEEMTEEEKEEEKEVVNQATFKKVLPSVVKITVFSAGVFGAIAAVNITATAVTATAVSGFEIAKSKAEDLEAVVKQKVSPEEKKDIDNKIDERIRRYMSNNRSTVPFDEDVKSVSKVIITDEFGNRWRGYYSDVVNAKNYVNEMINDDENVSLNDFYEKIPGCHTTILGTTLKFMAYKGMISVKPEAILNDTTGELEEILLTYPISPVIMDAKKYKYSKTEEESYDAFRATHPKW